MMTHFTIELFYVHVFCNKTFNFKCFGKTITVYTLIWNMHYMAFKYRHFCDFNDNALSTWSIIASNVKTLKIFDNFSLCLFKI